MNARNTAAIDAISRIRQERLRDNTQPLTPDSQQLSSGVAQNQPVQPVINPYSTVQDKRFNNINGLMSQFNPYNRY